MWKTLIEKIVTSRKFMVVLTGFLIKALTPLSVKWGFDLTVVSDALTEYMPLIITWLIGQSAVDFAEAKKKEEVPLPEPPPLP